MCLHSSGTVLFQLNSCRKHGRCCRRAGSAWNVWAAGVSLSAVYMVFNLGYRMRSCGRWKREESGGFEAPWKAFLPVPQSCISAQTDQRVQSTFISVSSLKRQHLRELLNQFMWMKMDYSTACVHLKISEHFWDVFAKSFNNFWCWLEFKNCFITFLITLSPTIQKTKKCSQRPARRENVLQVKLQVSKAILLCMLKDKMQTDLSLNIH